ncbi:muconate/chloromuconate family cycloisomerase [Salipaludibacillus sp. CUR1]|uniref:muconate/chloromuconate family cycloisomerase n=1 Tax=Salipaludibacillus sp. CUR1 TaxID=2820003 RepID=UPI001E6259E3|nr:muconate/chloromuconate family cycloisomerase [Salipaludibacillus sp. CUR1]MCE7792937.1 muconate/chloromuconate family cycloisomerase [Salipaludibacillus sp. CUR1]
MEKITIKQITTELIDIPIKRPHQFSAVKVSSKSFLLLRIELSNGYTGIGEGTTPGIFWNGESVETMKVVIDNYIAPLLIGEDAAKIESLLQTLNRQVRGNEFAKATVEMALFDGLGKTYDVPAHQLLGGLCRDRLNVRWALASGTPEGDINEAKEAVQSGKYEVFKIKSGKESARKDAERSLLIAGGIKGYSTIGIDPNGSWDRLTAMSWMDAFFEAGIDFLEQPLAPHDFEGLAQLTAMKKVPVMADESVATIHDAIKLAKEQAVHIFSLKIHKAGGLKNTIKVAGIAEASGISCFGGTSLESSIGTAACLHAYGSIPNLDYGCELFGPDWLADEIVRDPVVCKEGQIYVPDKPGLGIELDEQKVQLYARKEKVGGVH